MGKIFVILQDKFTLVILFCALNLLYSLCTKFYYIFFMFVTLILPFYTFYLLFLFIH